MTYKEFLKSKQLKTIEAGFDADESILCDALFPFQRDIVKWATKKGKAAILIGCGLGKTIIQLSWADQVCKHTGRNVLIIAPLSVVNQTAREADFFGTGKVHICRTQKDVGDGINITNYEMVEHFDASSFIGVVLDESSILKSFTSRTTQDFTDKFSRTPYKLLCTATIAPNDYTEIGTSCEFLGIMSRSEMLATYFVHDGGDTAVWRLKKAGVNKFWEWFATWAIAFNNPNELGYEIEGYDLPPLNIHQIVIESQVGDYEFMVRAAETLQERREARKESLEYRAKRTVELTQDNNEQWLVWVDFNDESELLKRMMPEATEVKGADDPEYKARASIDFANGDIRVLVSKPSIFGFGSNFQSCHNEIFCGISDSYERFYQAVRRCWRFGQKHPVDVYIILSEKEINMLTNIQKKEKLMEQMQHRMTELMREVTLAEIKHTTRITTDYKPEKVMTIPAFLKGEK